MVFPTEMGFRTEKNHPSLFIITRQEEAVTKKLVGTAMCKSLLGRVLAPKRAVHRRFEQ